MMDTVSNEGGFTRSGRGHIDCFFGEYDQGFAHFTLETGALLHVHEREQIQVLRELARTPGNVITFVADAFGIVREFHVISR